MMTLRLINQAGNRHDVSADVVPRIGERVTMSFAIADEAPALHHFRVKDIDHRMNHRRQFQITVLLEEELDAPEWAE
jgi:hypothetical protein